MTKFLEKPTILSRMLLIALIAAMAISFVSCEEGGNSEEPQTPQVKTFVFEVIFADGTTNIHNVTSTRKTVGQALIDEGLLEGENGPYGLYVKTVDGVTLDYNRDGKYWAFYVNGEYAMAGVDRTDIVDGVRYTFKAE